MEMMYLCRTITTFSFTIVILLDDSILIIIFIDIWSNKYNQIQIFVFDLIVLIFFIILNYK